MSSLLDRKIYMVHSLSEKTVKKFLMSNERQRRISFEFQQISLMDRRGFKINKKEDLIIVIFKKSDLKVAKIIILTDGFFNVPNAL